MKILNTSVAVAGMDCLEESGFFFFLDFIGWYDFPLLSYEINSVSKFKMSESSQLVRLIQGQSDESTLLYRLSANQSWKVSRR